MLTGEFLPKSLFKINPSGVLVHIRRTAVLSSISSSYPISKFASGISYLCLRMFGMKINRDTESKAFGKG
jgi:CBS domain containing-hemolysin-like protein